MLGPFWAGGVVVRVRGLFVLYSPSSLSLMVFRTIMFILHSSNRVIDSSGKEGRNTYSILPCGGVGRFGVWSVG